MSDSGASLNHKMASAADLLAVVRTMKAMSAANINQYERAVTASDNYYHTVELGLVTCFLQNEMQSTDNTKLFSGDNKKVKTGILVFGSDQGLVGQFNDKLAEFVLADSARQPGEHLVWVVGERLHSILSQANVNLQTGFILPKSIKSISPLVGEILLAMETYRTKGKINQVIVFHNRPDNSHSQSALIYKPFKQHLLPLDANWKAGLMAKPWPTSNLPEVINAAGGNNQPDNFRNTLLALIHEFLFVSIYRACAESMASENASRLSAMQRAEKNIDELLETMNNHYHNLRQSGIDEELFDVVSGFKALREQG